MTDRSVIAEPLVRDRRRRNRRRSLIPAAVSFHLLPLVLPLSVLLIWQLATMEHWLAPQILPSPKIVAATLIDLVTSGDILTGLAISLRRILVGFTLGAAAGLILGVALGRSARIEHYVGPSLRAVAQVPSLGWLPFFMLIFGLGETLNYVVIAKACFVPIALTTAAGIRNIPARYIEVARVLRLRRATMVLRVFLPGALPTIFSGVRIALGQAWIAMVVVEMLADTAGLGYMMVWGRTLFQIDIVLVGMIVVGFIGFLMDAGLRATEHRLRRWSPHHV